MAYRLVQESRGKDQRSAKFVVKDYDQEPQLCRRGVWSGLQREYQETVVLSFDHEPDPLAVGWTVDDHHLGGGPGTPPNGEPIPTAPGVRAVTPYGNPRLHHKIALISTPGTWRQCLRVQPVFTDQRAPLEPMKHGPAKVICLSGYQMVWPSHLLREEEECLARFSGFVDERYNFRLPLEQWINFADGPDGPLLPRLQVAIEALDSLDREADREIIAAANSEVGTILERLRYRAFREHSPDNGLIGDVALE